MSWTSPRTWIAGEIVTAALLNTHLRDDLNALADAPTSPTTTGTQAALAIPAGRGPLVIHANNAALLTIQGITPGQNEQLLTIISLGAGQVDIENLSAGAITSSYRVVNHVTATISLAPGSGRVIMRYDGTNGPRWRVVHHEQGAWIPYTPVWTSTGTAPSLGNGTLTGSFRLYGRTLEFRVVLLWGSTTTGGTGVWTFTFPAIGSTPWDVGSALGAAMILDNGTGFYTGGLELATATTFAILNSNAISGGLGASVPMTWAVNDAMRVSGKIELS